MRGATTVFAVLLLLLGGCAIERHYGLVPGKDQVIEVESGDRWYFKMDGDPADRWLWDCNDDDVEVVVNYSETGRKFEFLIRIHRGYDGPSTVTFTRIGKDGRRAESFAITLFKRTGDEAFWK